MGAAADFRTIADTLAARGAGLAPRDDSATTAALVELANAGKAALEAAAAAEVGPGVIVQALEGLGDELAAAGFANDAQMLTVEEFLKTVLIEFRNVRKQVEGSSALTRAYVISAGRLLRITEQAEATGAETSKRVALENRRALQEAAQALDAAGLKVEVTARRS